MEMNSIYMMRHSGARGSPQQMKQLAGMRGLMARPDGSIIETPILSNFKEGLTVLEYFNSTHGARKGLADTALKTANSGYLTRRLVDVANDCIITAEDCGTKKGVTVQAEIDGGQVVASLTERILGRTTAEDIKHPDTGEIIVKRGKEVTEDLAEKIESAHVQKVRVRSVLTCELPEGVCGKCYGRDLARGTSVNIGEAVGVIAAQSIGEPGTQLTMRTFHIGGAAQVAGQSKIEASYDGKIKIVNRNIVKNSDGELIAMGRNMQVVITDNKGQERATYRITYGARLKVDEGATVKRGDRLAEWNPERAAGADRCRRHREVRRPGLRRHRARSVGRKDRRFEQGGDGQPRHGFQERARSASDHRRSSTRRARSSSCRRGGEARYAISADAILSVEDGAEVRAGDVLARIPTEGAKTRDITGGLPRVAELFEARKPKEAAVLAETDGFVEFGKDYKNKRRVIVKPKSDKIEPSEYLIPKGKHISVREGDYVEKGDYIVEGNPIAARHPAHQGHGGTGDLSRQGNPGRLSAAGREDQRQAYRSDLPPDDAEAGNHRRRRHHADRRRACRSARDWKRPTRRRSTRAASPPKAAPSCSASPRRRLQTRSVFSAASFQETTRVLTDAAVNGKVDMLEGLKENVIVGPSHPGRHRRRHRPPAPYRHRTRQGDPGGSRRRSSRWPRWKRRSGRRIGTLAHRKESGPPARAALFLWRLSIPYPKR